MEHHNHHHGLSGEDEHLNRAFYWAISLNLIYVLIESGFGFYSNSMGLLSDAGHNLSDVASLFISLIAFKAAKRPPTLRFTYGYGRATIEASLANAVILYVAVILIIIESINKLLNPVAVEGDVIAWVAGAGVIVNGATTWILMRYSHKDLNVKGAFMHMLADTFVSIGVVVSGIVIQFTGWNFIDPVIGIVIAVIIAVTSYSLLNESMRLALDGVPKDIDIKKVESSILSVPGVKSLHHLHVWSMSTTKNALTVHVIVDNPNDIDDVIARVRDSVTRQGIAHSTIEAETREYNCCTAPECI